MIEPVLHRIIVKPDNIEEKDSAYKAAKELGIIIHRDEKSREQAAVDSGEVLSIGATAFRDFGTAPPIKEGDHIVYARYAGKAIVDGGVTYIALNDEDVIAKITEGA